MSYRIDPGITAQLGHYGGQTAAKCFNCGNCTAVCSLSEEDAAVPRRYIRYIQLGLKEKMLGSLDPWSCFYCGDCSRTCPREAEPGNLMMASRRWLTSMYDWTGLSRLMYRDGRWELAVLAAVAVLVLLLFTVPAEFGFRLLAANPASYQNVNLEHFAPKHVVHVGDLAVAFILGGLLLSNGARMAWYVTRQGPRAPLWLYVTQFKEMVVQLLTQKRWRGCETGATKLWLRHLLLVSGYVIMAVMVEFFLQTFQVTDSSFHWTSILGYYATVVLLGATTWMMVDRLKKTDQSSKHTDLTDWAFLILLFLTALTGIVLHALRMLNLPMPTYVMYMVHLMIAIPMLVVMVPFGKWSHILYRPLALYLLAVQRKAKARETAGVPATQPVAA